jgi:hypothetical protein
VEGFHDIKYGVLAAQKAGLAAQQNLSCFSLDALKHSSKYKGLKENCRKK